MQKWLACITTARPSGRMRRSSASASITTASSWICGRPSTHSARRAYLDKPIRSDAALGSTPIHTWPRMGHRWCEQALRTFSGPTIISSFSCDTLGNAVTAGAGA